MIKKSHSFDLINLLNFESKISHCNLMWYNFWTTIVKFSSGNSALLICHILCTIKSKFISLKFKIPENFNEYSQSFNLVKKELLGSAWTYASHSTQIKNEQDKYYARRYAVNFDWASIYANLYCPLVHFKKWHKIYTSLFTK